MQNWRFKEERCDKSRLLENQCFIWMLWRWPEVSWGVSQLSPVYQEGQQDYPRCVQVLYLCCHTISLGKAPFSNLQKGYAFCRASFSLRIFKNSCLAIAIKHIRIRRWEDCARLCRQRVGCRYWVFQHFALQCETLLHHDRRDLNSLLYHDETATAGNRNCGSNSSWTVDNGQKGKKMPCPSKSLGLRYPKGPNPKWKSKVPSWAACALECRRGKNCNYWTWYHQNSEHPFYCGMYKYVTKIEKDENVISGDANCSIVPKLRCPTASMWINGVGGKWARTEW